MKSGTNYIFYTDLVQHYGSPQIFALLTRPKPGIVWRALNISLIESLYVHKLLLFHLILLCQKYKNKVNAFDSFENSKKCKLHLVLWFLTDSNNSACRGCFCTINNSTYFYFDLSIFQSLNTNHQMRDQWTLFLIQNIIKIYLQ